MFQVVLPRPGHTRQRRFTFVHQKGLKRSVGGRPTRGMLSVQSSHKMENLVEPWLTHILATLIGVAIGSGASWFVWSGRPKVRAAKAVEADFKGYREKVAEHFAGTASLVNDMTDSYRSVFEQLQAGANELLDETTRRQMLGDQDQDTITLHRLGWQPSSEETPIAEPPTQAGESADEAVPEEVPTVEPEAVPDGVATVEPEAVPDDVTMADPQAVPDEATTVKLETKPKDKQQGE